ncbi:hypothetical protein KUCAC02_031996 [Chaenocephalus aceratus]|nr:hypothetical protein KUCAC02_031996 [Chaenocephalus aceratus]
MFEEWTPDRSPSHFMVDFSEVEIGALEEEFQGSKVLLCDFHRRTLGLMVQEERSRSEQRTDSLLPLLRSSGLDSRGGGTRLCNLQEPKWVHVFRDADLEVAFSTNKGTTSLPAKTQESLPRRLFKRELLQDITTLQLTRLDVADKNNRLHPQDIGVGAESILKSTTGVELTVLEFRRDCMQG